MFFLVACTAVEPGISGSFGSGEAWGMTFGGSGADEAWGLAATDTGVLVGTHASSPGELPDAWVYRIDGDGPPEAATWSLRWGGSGLDKTFPVVLDGDRAYVGGTTYEGLDNTSADGFVLALDAATGELAWEWAFDAEGYEEVDDVVPAGDALYVSGWSTGGTNDAMLGALTREGALSWTVGWDSGTWDEANGGMVVTEDALYIAGLRDGAGYAVGGAGMIAAFDLTGALLWMEDVPGCEGYCDALGLASDGSALYTVGTAMNGLAPELDLHAFSLDGEALWSRRVAGEESAFARAVDARDGLVYVAANVDDDVDVRSFDAASGEPAAAVTWAGAGIDRAHEIAVTADAVWVVGDTDSMGAGSTDGVLLRFPLDLGDAPPTD